MTTWKTAAKLGRKGRKNDAASTSPRGAVLVDAPRNHVMSNRREDRSATPAAPSARYAVPDRSDRPASWFPASGPSANAKSSVFTDLAEIMKRPSRRTAIPGSGVTASHSNRSLDAGLIPNSLAQRNKLTHRPTPAEPCRFVPIAAMPWHRNSVTRAGRPSRRRRRIGLPWWWRRRSRSGGAAQALRHAARAEEGLRQRGPGGVDQTVRAGHGHQPGGPTVPRKAAPRGPIRGQRRDARAASGRWPGEHHAAIPDRLELRARHHHGCPEDDTSPAPRCRRPDPEQKAAAPQRRDSGQPHPDQLRPVVVHGTPRFQAARHSGARADANRRGSAAIADLNRGGIDS